MTMTFGFYWFLLLSMPCYSLGSYHEELGLWSWPLFNTCRCRRSFDRRVCCGDHHCGPGECCRASFLDRGLTAVGSCVPPDPNTFQCTRERHCYRHSDCGTGACCRFARGKNGRGVCDRLGRQGDACTAAGSSYNHGYFSQRCPCDHGMTCQAVSGSRSGLCGPPTTVTTPTTTTPTTTTPTTTTPTTTTTEDTCGGCPDANFFCCKNGSCRTRPTVNEPCGLNTCPCLQSFVCSDPTSPGSQGVCQ